MKIRDTDALVVVDIQNDFTHPNGALYVKDGETIIPIVNLWIELFRTKNLDTHIYFTQDWHPPNHSSFAKHGGLWPEHCVQHTWGAEIHQDIGHHNIHIYKGEDARVEEYSGFDSAILEADLLAKGVTRIFVCGLATDYCVFNTVIDGLRAGFEVILIKKGVKGVDFNIHDEGLHDIPTCDSEIAIGRMVLSGAKVI